MEPRPYTIFSACLPTSHVCLFHWIRAKQAGTGRRSRTDGRPGVYSGPIVRPGSAERCAGLASGRTCRSAAPCRWTVIVDIDSALTGDTRSISPGRLLDAEFSCIVFGRSFVKRFVLCDQAVVCLSCLVCL